MRSEVCETHLIDALDAADRLLQLTDGRMDACDHDDCMVLDGILRDCAMKIRRSVAECEVRVLEVQNRN